MTIHSVPTEIGKIPCAVPVPGIQAARRRSMNRVGSRSVNAAPPAHSVGQRLVARRLELNLTQAEVAERVKIYPKSGPNRNMERTLSRNGYCTYERGRHEPSLDLLRRLANALGVSPAWLAFGITQLSTPSQDVESSFPTRSNEIGDQNKPSASRLLGSLV